MAQEGYVERIDRLAAEVSDRHSEVDLFETREDDPTVPTMAFSEFLINKEQGDWAEAFVKTVLNGCLDGVRGLEYGRAQDKVAGEPGFEEYYRGYHEELDEIGKCPDLLVYDDSSIDRETADRMERVEEVPRNQVIEEARDAIAGLEVRSSSFLAGEYRDHQRERGKEIGRRIEELWGDVSSLSEQVLAADELYDRERWRTYVGKVREYKEADSKGDAPVFRTTSPIKRMASDVLSDAEAERFLEATDEIRELKKETFERDFLSFTPKVEDLIVISRWIRTHEVPHFYVQVFFDEVHVIPFEGILELLADPEEEGRSYYFERNQKNQLKNTIHIDIAQGERIVSNAPMPTTSADYKRLPRGRVLHYVSFETANGALGRSVVDAETLADVIGGDQVQ